MKKPGFHSAVCGVVFSVSFSASSVYSQEWREPGRDRITPMRGDKQALRTAEQTLAKNEAQLMSIPGVVGVGVGLTERGDRPAIHVYVNVKATGGRIPSAVPKQLNTVSVRVIPTDEIKAY